MLRKLNKQAEAIFRRLTEGMNRMGEHRVIDNTEGTFMPVHVEVIRMQGESLVISVAHYFKQNGDLCCDPDMTFLVNETGIYPLTFEQQGGFPIYQEAVQFEEEGIRIAPLWVALFRRRRGTAPRRSDA